MASAQKPSKERGGNPENSQKATGVRLEQGGQFSEGLLGVLWRFLDTGPPRQKNKKKGKRKKRKRSQRRNMRRRRRKGRRESYRSNP